MSTKRRAAPCPCVATFGRFLAWVQFGTSAPVETLRPARLSEGALCYVSAWEELPPLLRPFIQLAVQQQLPFAEERLR